MPTLKSVALFVDVFHAITPETTLLATLGVNAEQGHAVQLETNAGSKRGKDVMETVGCKVS